MIMPLKPKRDDAFPLAAVAVGAGLTVIVVVLMIMSRAPGATGRMNDLTAKGRAVAAAAQADGDLKAFPLGSVCSGVLDDSFKDQLNIALTNSGLTVSALDVSEAGTVGGAQPLNAYHLTLKGSGSYESALTALEILRHDHPKLFLDSLAIRNRTSSVDVDVEGRLFCR